MNDENGLGLSTARLFQEQAFGHFQGQTRILRFLANYNHTSESITKEGIFSLGLKLCILIKTSCHGRFFSVYKASQF